jgi:hypothetical protein
MADVALTAVSNGQVTGHEVQDPQDLTGQSGEDQRDAPVSGSHGRLLKDADRHNVEERYLREVDHDLLRALLKDLQ